MVGSVVEPSLKIHGTQWSSKTAEMQVHSSMPTHTYPHAYPHENMHMKTHNTHIHKQNLKKINVNPLYIKNSNILKDSKSQWNLGIFK